MEVVMDNKPSVTLVGYVVTGNIQIETTLRNTIEGVFRSKSIREGRNPNDWWENYVPSKTLDTWRLRWKNLQQEDQKRPWTLVSFGELVRIIEDRDLFFKIGLFLPQDKSNIHTLIASLNPLVQLRNKFAHAANKKDKKFAEGLVQCTFQDVKQALELITTILEYIPSQYHEPSNLTDYIKEGWERFCQEEVTNITRGVGRISHRVETTRRELREVLTLMSAFNAGKDNNQERFIGLSFGAHSQEEVNRIKHAYVSGVALQDASLGSDIGKAFANTIIYLLSWREEEAKKAFHIAQDNFGEAYLKPMIGLIKDLRDDPANDMASKKHYSDFLRWATNVNREIHRIG
jgi:hypothetical protein